MTVSGAGGSCREDARFNWDSENQQCNQSVVDVTRKNERTNYAVRTRITILVDEMILMILVAVFMS